MKKRPKGRKRSAPSRLRPFWALFIVIAAAAAAGGYYAASWPGFRPTRVIVAGNRNVPAARIVAAAGIRTTENLWLQNMRAASARVAAIPSIGSVHVHRWLPAGVRIDVSERTPFAWVVAPGRTFLVDRSFHVLRNDGRAPAGAPVLIVRGANALHGTALAGPQLAPLAADYEALRAAHVPVAQLGYDRFGDLYARTRSGVVLLLGADADLSAKTPLIDPILSQTQTRGRSIAQLDLRAPRTPVVRYSEH